MVVKYPYKYMYLIIVRRGHRGRDRMVVLFITSCAISASLLIL